MRLKDSRVRLWTVWMSPNNPLFYIEIEVMVYGPPNEAKIGRMLQEASYDFLENNFQSVAGVLNEGYLLKVSTKFKNKGKFISYFKKRGGINESNST